MTMTSMITITTMMTIISMMTYSMESMAIFVETCRKLKHEKKTQKAEVEYLQHQFNRSPTQQGHLLVKQVGLIHSKSFVLALYLHL